MPKMLYSQIKIYIWFRMTLGNFRTRFVVGYVIHLAELYVLVNCSFKLMPALYQETLKADSLFNFQLQE